MLIGISRPTKGIAINSTVVVAVFRIYLLPPSMQGYLRGIQLLKYRHECLGQNLLHNTDDCFKTFGSFPIDYFHCLFSSLMPVERITEYFLYLATFDIALLKPKCQYTEASS